MLKMTLIFLGIFLHNNVNDKLLGERKNHGVHSRKICEKNVETGGIG